MEPVRYRPGEAIRWLDTGADDMRRNAARKGKSVIRREGHRSLGKDIKEAAGALFDVGKSALADLAHKQAMSSEYVLHEDHFEVIRPGALKSYRYADVRSLSMRGDKLLIEFERGSISIRPHAYIVAGRLRVPVGWERNGIEVAYDLLPDELSARIGKDIDFG